jgi:outer membrane protein TolC
VLQAQDALARTSLQWADSRAAWLRARWRLAAAVGRLGPLAFE